MPRSGIREKQISVSGEAPPIEQNVEVNGNSDKNLVSKPANQMEEEVHQRPRTSGSTVLQFDGSNGSASHFSRRQTVALQLSNRSLPAPHDTLDRRSTIPPPSSPERKLSGSWESSGTISTTAGGMFFRLFSN